MFKFVHRENHYFYHFHWVAYSYSFNKNGMHCLIYLTGWSPAGGTSWERLGDVALLEEVCYWEPALSF